jgi:O-antigen/teichoic acid export membrane protein
LLTYLLLATTVASFGLLVCARLALPLIAPPEYAEAFMVVLLLIPAQGFVGIHLLAETLLGAARKTHIAAALNAVSACICIALNFALIPSLGWLGAVLATTISVVGVDLLELSFGIHAFHAGRDIEWRRIAITAFLFGALMLSLFLLREIGLLLFPGAALLVFAVAAAFIFFVPFCHDSEKTFLRDTAVRVRARLLARGA